MNRAGRIGSIGYLPVVGSGDLGPGSLPTCRQLATPYLAVHPQPDPPRLRLGDRYQVAPEPGRTGSGRPGALDDHVEVRVVGVHRQLAVPQVDVKGAVGQRDPGQFETFVGRGGEWAEGDASVGHPCVDAEQSPGQRAQVAHVTFGSIHRSRRET